LESGLAHSKSTHNNDGKETLFENKSIVQEALKKINLVEIDFPR